MLALLSFLENQKIMDDIDRYHDLFAGRQDAYGGDEGRAIYGTVGRQAYLRHLMGEEPIGIYPIIHDAENNLWVRWGCCDIDTGDWNEAYQLWLALDAMGMRPFVERSRSKGWHVWVFASTWVPASDMRRALKVAYKAIGLPAKEANPKSEVLRPNQLGNYVRLPYKGGLVVPSDRQCFMGGFDANHDGKPLGFKDFLGCVETVSQETIKHWATKWYEPPRAATGITVEETLSDEHLRGLVSRLPIGLRTLWEKGPKQSNQRSDGLAALAHQTAQRGFTPQQVFQLVVSADRLWGKYWDRVNGQDYLLDIVERAFR